VEYFFLSHFSLLHHYSATILMTTIRISYFKNAMTLFTIHGGNAFVSFTWLF
jgi:hypothetical protein